MTTWAEGGLLESVGEVLVFINEQTPVMADVLLPYTAAPYNVKVMSSQHNGGITRGLNW